MRDTNGLSHERRHEFACSGTFRRVNTPTHAMLPPANQLALFLAYNVGGRGDLEALKLRLLQSTPDFLRPDAALLLLSLYDQMVFRPFTGPILSPTREWMKIPPIGLDLASFNQRVTNSLDMIFEELGKVQARPASSHQVLLVLVNSWPAIRELFGWA